ncbi:MAG: hypothetical protein WAO36_09520 [Candidatus Methanoculleus thermohydrogenotrophicum]|nr:hypothetical protein [Candidatus Methanoculleus thermohydrogenotrophicum]
MQGIWGDTEIERELGYLAPGDAFRDWLTGVLADRLPENDGDVRVYLAGVKGAEREDPTLQGGDESRAALRHTLA